MRQKYYIAYGSNLNLEQMAQRCPGAKVFGTGIIENYELSFKGMEFLAFLTIEPKQGSTVPVAIWTVTEQDEESLDGYEGCPMFYYKKEMDIQVKCIDSDESVLVNAFVYIMNEDRCIGYPSSQYLLTCMDGYGSFGFDRRYLIDAYERVQRRYDNDNYE